MNTYATCRTGDRSKRALLELLIRLRREESRSGYGAPGKGTPFELLWHPAGLLSSPWIGIHISLAFPPGTQSQSRIERLNERKPDYILILP
jgi:hypothetical protein